MEVPRFWRTMPVNTSFTGREVGGVGEGKACFRFPGGEISLHGSYEEVYSRFENKGFKSRVIDQILFDLFGAVASESAISFEKIANSQSELVGSEVRKENRSEEKLRINRLPRKISGKTLFSSSANN